MYSLIGLNSRCSVPFVVCLLLVLFKINYSVLYKCELHKKCSFCLYVCCVACTFWNFMPSQLCTLLHMHTFAHYHILQKFGVMLSCTMRISTHFLGTGESYLFSVEEFGKLQVYTWSGLNDYFFQGNSDSIAFGSDE